MRLSAVGKLKPVFRNAFFPVFWSRTNLQPTQILELNTFIPSKRLEQGFITDLKLNISQISTTKKAQTLTNFKISRMFHKILSD